MDKIELENFSGIYLKLDFDDVPNRIYEAQVCLHNIMKPFYVRVSSGKRGFHVLKFCTNCDWLVSVWDDKRRRIINEVRKRNGFIGNILFDIKTVRGKRRAAGEWQLIKDSYDVERFIDFWRP
ncbi:MAG TPA: hypothetical protein VKL21_08095 [Candidatus Methanoperedens sp.]|nr:hypothetical protein [Candidatus Methanoperedens sp.]